MFPSTQEFLINVPLYSKYNLKSYSPDYIFGLEYFSGTIDAYCLGCGQRSVFKRARAWPQRVPQQDYREKYLDDRQFLVEMECTRDEHHTMRFYFEVLDSEVFKVGQYPTLADLQEHEIVKYRKYLGRQYPEFTRAVGLFAHGIGIGSYVYLRRIIESLVQQAHVRAQKDTDWVEDNYQSSRFHERIAMLKDYLPEVMVENAGIYSILSKGIHELTEAECLEHFTTLKSGIELILDEEIARQARERKFREITQGIRRIKGEIS